MKPLLLGLVLTGLPAVLRAQEKMPYVMPRFEGQFRLNGIPDESGWKALSSLPATMHMLTVHYGSDVGHQVHLHVCDVST